MPKSSRFSFSLASAIFILILGFAPAALGQSAVSGRAGSGSIVLSQTLPGLLVFGPAGPSGSDHRDRGCDSRQDKRGKCSSVPEGGTAFAYLALVALGCVAAGIFAIRRQAHLHETK